MDFSQGNTTDSMFRQSTGFCRLSFFCTILLPYIPFSMRQPLLIFTKFLELKECMSCPKNRLDFGQAQSMDSADVMSDIFTKLSPFLSEQERAQFSQMQNMMQMLKLYQTFQELAPMMNMGGDGGFSPDNLAAWANMANTMASGMNPEPPGFFGAMDGAAPGNMGAGTSGAPSFATDDAGGTPSNSQSSNSGMADMLFSMLSPDQKEMYENLKSVMSEPPAE